MDEEAGGKIRIRPKRSRLKFDQQRIYLAQTKSKRLKTAVLTNNEDAVRELLLNKVNVNMSDERQRTPLHLASSLGFASIVKLLLEFGANPGLKDSLGNTPLHLASCTGNINVIKELLAAGADAQVLDSRGCSPNQLAQGRLRLLASWAKSAAPQDASVLMQQVQKVVDSLAASLTKTQAEKVDQLRTQLPSNATPSDHISALLNELENLTI